MKKIEYIQKILKRVHDDSEQVLNDHYNVFKPYADLVNRLPEKLRTPFTFHDFLRRQHGSATALFIRRQLDTKNMSLFRLLDELEKNSELISIDFFKSLYGEKYKDWAINDFKQFTKNGINMDKAMAKKDKVKLTQLGEPIKKYVGAQIAHRSDKEPKLITYDDLDTFLHEFEEILKKYALLLTGNGYISITPIDQTNWMKIFKQKWID